VAVSSAAHKIRLIDDSISESAIVSAMDTGLGGRTQVDVDTFVTWATKVLLTSNVRKQFDKLRRGVMVQMERRADAAHEAASDMMAMRAQNKTFVVKDLANQIRGEQEHERAGRGRHRHGSVVAGGPPRKRSTRPRSRSVTTAPTSTTGLLSSPTASRRRQRRRSAAPSSRGPQPPVDAARRFFDDATIDTAKARPRRASTTAQRRRHSDTGPSRPRGRALEQAPARQGLSPTRTPPTTATRGESTKKRSRRKKGEKKAADAKMLPVRVLMSLARMRLRARSAVQVASRQLLRAMQRTTYFSPDELLRLRAAFARAVSHDALTAGGKAVRLTEHPELQLHIEDGNLQFRRHQFKRVMIRLYPNLKGKDATMDLIFDGFDVDNSGQIDFKEFVTGLGTLTYVACNVFAQCAVLVWRHFRASVSGLIVAVRRWRVCVCLCVHAPATAP